MTFQILPATVSDGPAIARIIVWSYMEDSFAKSCYKTFTAEDRIESCKARFPRSLTSKNSWHLKVVDENGETISYSRWKLPEELWQTLRKENADMIEEVSAEDKERYEQEYAKNHIDDWPIGINKDMVMPMEASMDEARKVFPTGPSILLDGLNTHPSHQRKGAASSMLKWGIELADTNNLKIRLEGTPAGVPIYKAYGFQTVATVVHHLKEHGGPEEYIHVLMVREPVK